jgi:hypothetical protein
VEGRLGQRWTFYRTCGGEIGTEMDILQDVWRGDWDRDGVFSFTSQPIELSHPTVLIFLGKNLREKEKQRDEMEELVTFVKRFYCF